jgi:hypothetical protein
MVLRGRRPVYFAAAGSDVELTSLVIRDFKTARVGNRTEAGGLLRVEARASARVR